MYAKILKANPYHDELGRFTSKDKAAFTSTGEKFSGTEGVGDVFYHGTTSEAAKDILREGLVVGKGGGSDDWARKHGFSMIQAGLAETKRKASVFVAKSMKDAETYADRKSTRLNSSHITRSRMPSSA